MDSYYWRAYFHAYGVKTKQRVAVMLLKHKVTEGDRRKKKTEDGESAGMHICDNRTRSRIPRTCGRRPFDGIFVWGCWRWALIDMPTPLMQEDRRRIAAQLRPIFEGL